jgi:hypothetical protein
VELEVGKMDRGAPCVLDEVPLDPVSPLAKEDDLQGEPEHFEAIIPSNELGCTLHREVTS